GFVAIDTLNSMLPKGISSLLNLFLLIVCLLVLVVAIQIGWKEVNGIGGRFTSASLYLPMSFAFDEWFRLPRSWMMYSLVVGLVMLILVNIELIVRQIVQLFGTDIVLPTIPDSEVGGAE
ncbi:MAG: TRAP transporter small permease subunit, partial [Paracoccaceae bacterium]|nr:TRAP transporter small permease subunit [Paracoccaceae bacterium]